MFSACFSQEYAGGPWRGPRREALTQRGHGFLPRKPWERGPDNLRFSGLSSYVPLAPARSEKCLGCFLWAGVALLVFAFFRVLLCVGFVLIGVEIGLEIDGSCEPRCSIDADTHL